MWLALLTLSIVATLPLNVECCRRLPWRPPRRGKACIILGLFELWCYFLQVNCRWGNWSAWESCSVTCGGGSQERSRGVVQRPQNGGRKCEGRSTDVRSCGTLSCELQGDKITPLARAVEWTLINSFFISSYCTSSNNHYQFYNFPWWWRWGWKCHRVGDL